MLDLRCVSGDLRLTRRFWHTCQLPFRTVVAPQTNPVLLSHVANPILYFNQADSIGSPSPSHRFVGHPLIFAPCLGRWIVRPPAKAVSGTIAQGCDF